MDTTFISGWSNYLTVQAGVAATLTGLVFVAVSINLARILSVPGLTGRAAECLMQLAGALIIATTALIPRQPALVLGIEVLTLGVVLWIFQTVVQIRYMRCRTGHPRHWLVTRILQTQLACIPFCVGGILLIDGSYQGLYWLAPGFSFSLISGVASAWVLLVEILR